MQSEIGTGILKNTVGTGLGDKALFSNNPLAGPILNGNIAEQSIGKLLAGRCGVVSTDQQEGFNVSSGANVGTVSAGAEVSAFTSKGVLGEGQQR